MAEWKDFVTKSAEANKTKKTPELDDGFSVSVPDGWPSDSGRRIHDHLVEQIGAAPSTNTAPTQSDIDNWARAWPSFRRKALSVYDGKDVNGDLTSVRMKNRLKFGDTVKWKDYSGMWGPTNDVPPRLETLSPIGRKLLFDDYANATNIIAKIKNNASIGSKKDGGK